MKRPDKTGAEHVYDLNDQNVLELVDQLVAKETAIGWAVFGFLLAIVALPAVYLHKVTPPGRVMLTLPEDIDPHIFALIYAEELKAKRVTRTWGGAVFGIIFSLAIVGNIGAP